MTAPVFPTELRWTSHPARERGTAAVAVTLLILVVSTAAADLMNHWAYGIGSALFMFLTLRKFYWPTFFQLDQRGVSATHWGRTRSVDWREVIDFQHDARGGILHLSSPCPANSQSFSSSTLAIEPTGTRRGNADRRTFPLEFGLHRDEVIEAISKHRTQRDAS